MSAPSTGSDYAGCRTSSPNILPGRCARHGGPMVEPDRCVTREVLADIRAERARQFAKYGTNEDLDNGTGPAEEWLQGVDSWGSARGLEIQLRQVYEEYENQWGSPTWRHLVLEEVAEAFAESDTARLRAELVQVAALAVSWIEKLDTRKIGENRG